NRADLLGPCLKSLRAQTIRHCLIVVDNASNDGTTDLVATAYPEVRLLRLPRNVGFAGGVAEALQRIDTPFVALLNNDAAADPLWLERSVEVLTASTDVAAIAARMVLWD